MNGRARLGEELGEEIEWFRSFGWSNERIAERLGITVDCIEKRDRARAGESVAA
jgi:hypothetical protein